jgi:hypothetical protein
MTRQIVRGLSGLSPLGFLASLGLLRLCRQQSSQTRLGFLPDGSFRPFIEGFDGDLADCVAGDALAAKSQHGWLLEYEKEEKRGTKTVADLKAPPASFKAFLHRVILDWTKGDGEGAAYAAAFGTSTAVDGKGNTKPTALHFTAANQQFLGTIIGIRDLVSAEWARRSLHEGNAAAPGSNLRWDPSAERNWALMADNPNATGTQVDAPAEWLAFRGLPFLPSYPYGSRILTAGVEGRGDDMAMSWPLWAPPASAGSVRSALQLAWKGNAKARALFGVFAVCTSSIRRTSQGFGNFGPASVSS